MNFCPNCGTQFEPGARFCQECGFDIAKIVISKPEVLQHPKSQAKATKPWKWVAMIALLAGTLGFAVWFGYTEYFNPPKYAASDSIANMVFPEVKAADTAEIALDIPDEPEETLIEQPKTNTKKPGKVDQELAKQKAKQQKKTAPPTTTALPQTKVDQDVKISQAPAVKETTLVILLEIGRKEEPKRKNPKEPAKLVIKKPTMIARITTDHYNDGMGTPRGGIISIKDRDDRVIGSYKALGKTGKNGTPSAKWVIEPKIVLDEGTYFIWDSDMTTWSKNLIGNGFVVVEGYVVE
jgi:hypothetical protein